MAFTHTYRPYIVYCAILAAAAIVLGIPAANIAVAGEPAGDNPLATYTVDGVSPRGTTINLYDYWVTDRTAADSTDPGGIADLGINAGHMLHFIKNAGRSAEPYQANPGNVNRWTGSAHPRTAIVDTTLGADGYPQLSAVLGGASLDYLFSANGIAGKRAFPNVSGLLQVDDQGYYVYNSQTNFAQFNEATNAFTLYSAGGVNAGGSSPNGQFFPFNTGEQVFTVADGTLRRNGVTSVSPVINHYFGMTMATRFIQQYGGHVDESQTMPVTYNFSGDDDVWVYIDDVLIGDLGGIHNAASLQIDFATGMVVVYWDRNNNNTYDNGTDIPYQQTTLSDLFAAAGHNDPQRFDGHTFADNTYHTLDFYYLERGNTDSNMSLKYNLVSIPESGIRKTDQNGGALGGARFLLYPADARYQVTGNAVYAGRTDSNGELVFTNERGFPITLEQLDAQYDHLVLRETDTPAGYRNNGDIHLRFDHGALLSDNEWETGAWSQAVITATAAEPIRIDNGDGTISTVDPDNGEMFAVIMKRRSMSEPVDDLDNWAPVSGDALTGWHVGADSGLPSIVEAVRATPYPFVLGTNGAYQVEVGNLPGSVNQYYGMLADNGEDTSDAQYTVQYYYAADGDVGVRTIHRILTSPDADYPGFNYTFSVRLYISNIRNGFLVAKTDTEGQPLAGATFALYRKENGADAPSNAVPVDTATTGADGGLAFPSSGKTLDNGEYLLVETSAPDGYEANSRPVPITVSDRGVFADAGVAGDGVTVELGIGYLVHSMVQFAADDGIDATLHDVTATLQTSSAPTIPAGATSDVTWQDAGVATQLKYAGDGGLQYVPEHEGQPQTLGTDEGWSRLRITQLLDGSATRSTKQNLGDRDLAALFTGSVIVHVTDRRVAADGEDDGSNPDADHDSNGSSDSGNSPTDSPQAGTSRPATIAESGTEVIIPAFMVLGFGAAGVALAVMIGTCRSRNPRQDVGMSHDKMDI